MPFEQTLEQTKKEIAEAAASAVKVIAAAAQEAAKVVSDAAAVSVKVMDVKNASDHDLLIELKTKMIDLKSDIKDLKDGTSVKINNHENRIQSLEKDKIDPKEHEVLKEAKNKYFVMMLIYTAGVAVMIGMILFHIFQN